MNKIIYDNKLVISVVFGSIFQGSQSSSTETNGKLLSLN